MTLRGDTTQHPEPSIAPDDNHATLARILSVTPELVPTALANLIASEREAARAEFANAAAAAIDVKARQSFSGDSLLDRVVGPSVSVAFQDAAAIVRALANQHQP